ncbi:hypothetical protein TNCV_679351 [Trichonephila clavipes]|nr:hypothetical protein TNCV_679351 [Trichonephila clavipes]
MDRRAPNNSKNWQWTTEGVKEKLPNPMHNEWPGNELVGGVSSAVALVPLKICLVEGLMHVKSVVARSPPVGVRW